MSDSLSLRGCLSLRRGRLGCGLDWTELARNSARYFRLPAFHTPAATEVSRVAVTPHFFSPSLSQLSLRLLIVPLSCCDVLPPPVGGDWLPLLLLLFRSMPSVFHDFLPSSSSGYMVTWNPLVSGFAASLLRPLLAVIALSCPAGVCAVRRGRGEVSRSFSCRCVACAFVLLLCAVLPYFGVYKIR